MIPQHLFGKEDLWKVKVTPIASVIYWWLNGTLFFIYMGKASRINYLEDFYCNCNSIAGDNMVRYKCSPVISKNTSKFSGSKA